jgi:hypothetical protein
MHKLIIAAAITAGACGATLATVQATGNHHNTNGNQCTAQSVDHKEHDKKYYECTSPPCKYNDQLKADDKACVPPVDTPPVAPPTQPPAPVIPAEDTTTPAQQITTSIPDIEQPLPAFQGK